MNEWQMEELNFLRAMAKSMQGRIAELEARLATVAPVAAFQIDKKPCSEACETLGHYGECERDEHEEWSV